MQKILDNCVINNCGECDKFYKCWQRFDKMNDETIHESCSLRTVEVYKEAHGCREFPEIFDGTVEKILIIRKGE